MGKGHLAQSLLDDEVLTISWNVLDAVQKVRKRTAAWAREGGRCVAGWLGAGAIAVAAPHGEAARAPSPAREEKMEIQNSKYGFY